MTPPTERCPTCDREGTSCPTWDTLIRGTRPNSEVRSIALAAMRDCRAHAVDWRARCLAAEAALTTLRRDARAEIDRLEAALATLAIGGVAFALRDDSPTCHLSPASLAVEKP